MSGKTRNGVVGIASAIGLVTMASLAARLASGPSGPAIPVEAGVIRAGIGARAVVVPVGGVGQVRAPAPGFALSVAVRAGDRVRAGDVLARLDLLRLDHEVDLTAPVDGTVLARHVDPGDTVGVGPLPAALFEIADPTHLEARVEIDESDAARVVPGARVRLGEIEGRVDRLAPRIERRENPLDDVAARAASRVRLAWVALPDDSHLLVGQQLLARVDATPVNVAALVPRDALAVRDGQAVVRVHAWPWPREAVVAAGAADDENVAITGLAPGTLVLRQR